MSFVVLFVLHVSVLAYAFVGGVFLAFSDFIMRSLARTGGAGGVEAMQSINREVFRWVFMALFLGMAAVSACLVVYSVAYVSGGPKTLILIGALVYLLGCFAVTVVFNVPMNEALARMDPSTDMIKDYWADTYLPRWTLWNTVRTIACAVSAALMLCGLIWLAHGEMRLG